MDQNETIETAPETDETQTSFGMELLKTAASSAATSVGVLGGMVAIGFILDWRKNRQARKQSDETVETHETTSTTE